jgi:hypothetical protein
MTTSAPPIFPAAPFYTTRWTRVCLAKVESADGRQALADLCEAYYESVVAYLPCVLRDADEARMRQSAKQFLIQKQVDAVFAPPAK